jgi:hypothetical protein
MLPNGPWLVTLASEKLELTDAAPGETYGAEWLYVAEPGRSKLTCGAEG